MCFVICDKGVVFKTTAVAVRRDGGGLLAVFRC